MIEIHFYKETELKYSVYANSIEDVIEAPTSYYAEYTVDMVITDVKFLNPIYINGELREMTREEKVVAGIEVVLEEGEIIKRKKIIKIEKPSRWHTWAGTEWIVDLEEVKARKREVLKEIRKEKIDSDLEVNGDFFQVRERDLQNFYNLKIAVDLEPARMTMEVNWVLADNTIKEFSFTELMGVLGAYILRKQQLFTKFGELCARLETCNTIKEIDSIKWE